MIGIYTKTSLHTKNTGLTQSTLGCSHIKTALKNHSRSLLLLNSQRQRKLSKMKKQRNYSQLTEQEKSPERINNETDFTSLLDCKFKKEAIKMLKKLRKIIDRNANHL